MMKQHKQARAALIIIIAMIVLLAGCGSKTPEPPASDTSDANGAGATAEKTENFEDQEFTYSLGIDGNGFWKGIRALDYVELFDYKGLLIPKEVHAIPESQIQDEIDAIMESYSTEELVMDRAVRDGDTVNIDYVGYVDGKAFDRGSTENMGTDVTIGVSKYIDNFLEQLIGHHPGETFDVKVTFPKDYGVAELNGKAAVFVTTVNFIVELVCPELDDDFVYDNFYDRYGLGTVEELIGELEKRMRESAISDYIQDYLSNEVTVKSVPGFIMWYQENAMIDYYVNLAMSYGVGIEDLLDYMGVASLDELLIMSYEENLQWARFCLVLQAVAEDMDLKISDEDVKTHFLDLYNIEDYSEQEDYYGLPYLKQMVMHQKVMDYIIDHAVMG